MFSYKTAPVVHFFQHYDGDVRDLELTFSFDEDVLGKVRNGTFEKEILNCPPDQMGGQSIVPCS